MVGVGVRVDDELERAAVVGQDRDVAVDALPDRIDDDRLPRLLAGEQVGLALPAIELAKEHRQCTRNSASAALKASGSSRCGECALSSKTVSFASGICLARTSPFGSGTISSCRPCRMAVGTSSFLSCGRTSEVTTASTQPCATCAGVFCICV